MYSDEPVTVGYIIIESSPRTNHRGFFQDMRFSCTGSGDKRKGS